MIESMAIRCLCSRLSKMAFRVLRKADDCRRDLTEVRSSRGIMISAFGLEENQVCVSFFSWKPIRESTKLTSVSVIFSGFPATLDLYR